jgi:hypothetical protein
MTRFTKTVLLIAVALLLGFSISASAAKSDKEQLLVSPPLWGIAFMCHANNLSDADLEITLAYVGNSGFYDELKRTIKVGEIFYFEMPATGPLYCTVKWEGQPGDVRASFCSYSAGDYASDAACFEIF